jgi:hypothetical protein
LPKELVVEKETNPSFAADREIYRFKKNNILFYNYFLKMGLIYIEPIFFAS